MTSMGGKPYGAGLRPGLPDVAPPSVALAQNIAAYRALRRITQHELAARMTVLGHAMGRSAVGAIETTRRKVTVDELFGLAISIGVTIGQLLDPTGPDHSRPLALDVGLKTVDGAPRPIEPRLACLWVASRTVARLPPEAGGGVEFQPTDLPAAAERELERLHANASPSGRRDRRTGQVTRSFPRGDPSPHDGAAR